METISGPLLPSRAKSLGRHAVCGSPSWRFARGHDRHRYRRLHDFGELFVLQSRRRLGSSIPPATGKSVSSTSTITGPPRHQLTPEQLLGFRRYRPPPLWRIIRLLARSTHTARSVKERRSRLEILRSPGCCCRLTERLNGLASSSMISKTVYSLVICITS